MLVVMALVTTMLTTPALNLLNVPKKMLSQDTIGRD